MNKDVFEGKWKQIRGEVKAWWGILTHDDRKRAIGKFEAFTGMLQEKRGYSREQIIKKESGKRVTKHETN